MIDTEFVPNRRVLFIIAGCPHCRIWMEFIESYNMKLPPQLRIKVVDCAKYHDFGILDNPLIRVYKKYLGSYPIMFIGNEKVDGANSREELEAFIASRLRNEYLSEVNLTSALGSSIIFDKECAYKKNWFSKRTICK